MNSKRTFWTGFALLCAFALWTILIQYIDVQTAGSNQTTVGFASFNVWFHQITGVHMVIYNITDWLGLVPVFICFCFGILGLCQLIKRKSLLKVDIDIILLGVYYIFVIFEYLFFEMVPINYRPILIDGILEASYPSSTTLLVLSVMPTLVLQVRRRTDKQKIRMATYSFTAIFTAFMVIGRLIAGVHWATDIIGAVFLSTGSFMMYKTAVIFFDKKKV